MKEKVPKPQVNDSRVGMMIVELFRAAQLAVNYRIAISNRHEFRHAREQIVYANPFFLKSSFFKAGEVWSLAEWNWKKTDLRSIKERLSSMVEPKERCFAYLQRE